MWHRHSCLCRLSPRLRSQALIGVGSGRGTDKSVCATLGMGLRRQARMELVRICQNACIVEMDQTAPRRFSGLAFSAYAQSIRIMADS